MSLPIDPPRQDGNHETAGNIKKIWVGRKKAPWTFTKSRQVLKCKKDASAQNERNDAIKGKATHFPPIDSVTLGTSFSKQKSNPGRYNQQDQMFGRSEYILEQRDHVIG